MNEFNFNECSSKFPTSQGIYAIKGTYNNFHLVGQTQQSLKQRWSQHRQKLRQNKHDNPYLQNSFNKYGENNFMFIFIEECSDPHAINARECFWINHLNSMRGHNGWNLREGGSYGLYGPELRKRVSDGIRNSPLAYASRKARSKTYTIKNPEGYVITFTGMTTFCQMNGLSSAGLWRLLNHKCGVTQHKGWTLP